MRVESEEYRYIYLIYLEKQTNKQNPQNQKEEQTPAGPPPLQGQKGRLR